MCALIHSCESSLKKSIVFFKSTLNQALEEGEWFDAYVAKDDELGRKLQDLDLQTKKRAPKRKE
jgi:hypothetical protein